MIYHCYDAEVGGPLKEPSKDTFKKPTLSKPAIQRSCRVSRCSRRAPRFFAEQDYEGSGGVHSVLRSGVEQINFAHTVSPLGALPLPLSDVGRKHIARRRRTRYGHTGMGSCILTRTAVAPWSCTLFSLKEIPLSRKEHMFHTGSPSSASQSWRLVFGQED